MSAGKGDKPRPVNKKVYDQNYDEIFRSTKNDGFPVFTTEDKDQLMGAALRIILDQKDEVRRKPRRR